MMTCGCGISADRHEDILSNDHERHLNSDSQPLAGFSNDKAQPSNKRKPSETVRLKAGLKALTDIGIAPQAVWFHPEGGFEIRLQLGSDGQDDGFEQWFDANVAEAS